MEKNKLKVVGVVDAEDSEELMLIWRVSIAANKFRLVGKRARLEDKLKELGE